MSEKKTATKYCIGLEKKFGMGKLYAAMRGHPLIKFIYTVLTLGVSRGFELEVEIGYPSLP